MEEEKEQSVPEEGQNEEEQTATAEQSVSVEDLMKEIDQIKKAQAGSDRAYREEKKKREEAEKRAKQLEDAKLSDEERLKKELKEMQQQLQEKELREMRLSKVTEAGLPELSKVFDFDTKTEEGISELVGFVKEVIENKTNVKVQEEIDKRFPKKEPPKTSDQDGVLSYEQMIANKDQLKNMAPERVMEVYRKAVGTEQKQ